MRPPEILTSPAPTRLAEPAVATELEDRRRPTTARFTFSPDPRRLRDLLADVDEKLWDCEWRQRRTLRLLTAEIISRLLLTSPRTTIDLVVQQKPNSIRLDVWQATDGPCDFFESLDEAILIDLASAWGRDRRRDCGAWFEVR